MVCLNDALPQYLAVMNRRVSFSSVPRGAKTRVDFVPNHGLNSLEEGKYAPECYRVLNIKGFTIVARHLSMWHDSEHEQHLVAWFYVLPPRPRIFSSGHGRGSMIPHATTILAVIDFHRYYFQWPF